MMHAGVSTGTQPSQFIARGIVPKKIWPYTRRFSAFFVSPEPIEAIGVSYRGTGPADKVRATIRYSRSL
jgi:hypothetical protein